MSATNFVCLLLLAAAQLGASDKHPDLRGRVSGGFKSPPLEVFEEIKWNETGSMPVTGTSHGPQKRAGDPSPEDQDIGLAFDPSGCVFCPPNTQPGAMSGQDLLDFLTWQQMRTYQKGTDSDYKDTCVFYSAATSEPPDKLSGLATRWACDVKKYTIWHFWPNSVDAASGRFGSRDFYAMFEPPNAWLSPIRNLPDIPPPLPILKAKPAFIQYFEAMSQAMAERCTGEITIMSQKPDHLTDFSKFPINNIWGSTEYPALLRRRNLITRVVVVHATTLRVWELDLLTLTVGKEITVGDLHGHSKRDLLNATEPMPLHARADYCANDGLASEPDGMDWFGGDF